MQLPYAEVGAYCPGGQGSGVADVAFTGQYCPATAVHGPEQLADVDAVLLLNVPSGQGEHVTAAVVSLYCPIGHTLQTLAPGVE